MEQGTWGDYPDDPTKHGWKAGVAVCTQQLTSSKESGLGKVTKCTMTGAQFINITDTKFGIDSRLYCAKDIGDMSQLEGIGECKKLNAKLPLPKSEDEVKVFYKYYNTRTWIDLRDPKKTGDSNNWKDSEGIIPRCDNMETKRK